MSIAIRNVSKSFGATLAVEDVSFTLAENSFVLSITAFTTLGIGAIALFENALSA